MTSTTAIRTIAAAATLALLAGCGQHHADVASIAHTITANVQGQIQAFNAHDAQKAVSYDTPDWVGMAFGAANVEGAAADLAQTKSEVADPSAKMLIGDPVVDVGDAGDMAVSRTHYVYTYTDPATQKPVTEHGNWVQVWKPQVDGSWKAAMEVFSSTPAPKS